MERTELSLAGKLDSGLSRGICLLLGGLKTGSLWLLGLISLAALPWVMFEYDEGLADLSKVEWGFMPLLALLLWRHVRYCRHFATGIWLGLSRLFIAQGVMTCLYLVFIGLLAATLVHTEYLQAFLDALRHDVPISKSVDYGSILLALYLAAPTRGIVNSSAPAAISARVEPTVTPVAMEASL